MNDEKPDRDQETLELNRTDQPEKHHIPTGGGGQMAVAHHIPTGCYRPDDEDKESPTEL